MPINNINAAIKHIQMDRMIEILCRRQKNNPCLLGEPGVGKSALAEALAPVSYTHL